MRFARVLPILVGACSFTRGTEPGALDIDASTKPIDATVTTPDTPAGLGPWAPPQLIAELDSGTGDDDPSLTEDLLQIWWGSKQAGGNDEDIYFATRASVTAAWGTPTLAANINTFWNETTSRIAPSGLAIYFSSNRSGGDYQLYAATRANKTAAFTSDTQLGFSDPQFNEYAPAPRKDLLRLVFCAGTTVATEALYVSERASTSVAWGTPTKITELDVAGKSECDPIEPNDLTIYFSSNVTGDYDTYVARRPSPGAPYGAPQPVTEINMAGVNDRDAWVTADERFMVFSSNRGDGRDRLYFTSR